MSRASREKGKRGEREAAHALSTALGVSARRGQQHRGGEHSPDIVTDLSGVHIEVKRTERLNLRNAMDQAISDAGDGDVPVVMHRSSHQPWMVSVRLDDLPVLARSVMAVSDQSPQGLDPSQSSDPSQPSVSDQSDPDSDIKTGLRNLITSIEKLREAAVRRFDKHMADLDQLIVEREQRRANAVKSVRDARDSLSGQSTVSDQSDQLAAEIMDVTGDGERIEQGEQVEIGGRRQGKRAHSAKVIEETRKAGLKVGVR